MHVSMLVIRRILSAAGTVLLATLLCFVILRALPGDPARVVLGPLASDEALRSLRDSMGLNQPLPEQFWIYVRSFFTGDWGFSYSTGAPVSVVMGQRVMATLELALFAFVLAFVPAVALALIVTYRRRPTLDRIARIVSFVAIGAPPFWLALLVLLGGSQELGIFPGPEGRISPSMTPPTSLTGMYTVDALLTGNVSALGDALWHLLLPAIVLALPAFGLMFRLLRVNLLEVRAEPFLLVVRSKGISRWRAFVRHALPNAFLPTLTASGLVLAGLLTGSMLVEAIFDWPGIGALVVSSIQEQDLAVVQAFILLAGVAYVVINALIDVLYEVIDPRTRIPPIES